MFIKFFFRLLIFIHFNIKCIIGFFYVYFYSFPQKNLSAILNYSSKNINYYKNNRKKNILYDNEISNFSILEKKVLKSAVNNNSIYPKTIKSKVFTSYTTGSTGSPLKMSFDTNALQIKSYFQLLNDRKIGLTPLKKTIKIWRKKPLSFYEKTLIKAGLYHKIEIDQINSNFKSRLDNAYIKAEVDKIIKFKPKIIRGYVSAIITLALYIEKNSIKITSIEFIVATAETMDSFQIHYLKKVFKCKVINMYGGTEAPYIAISNGVDDKLKISNSLYFLEVVDENGHRVENGEEGQILVTDLFNRAMPLIRYKIGDTAIAEYNNKCLTHLTKVTGRTDDIITISDGTKILPHTWYIFFRDFSWIQSFQIIHKKSDFLNIKILPIDSKNIFLNELRNKVETNFPNLDFKWEIVEDIPDFKGKSKIIISKNE